MITVKDKVVIVTGAGQGLGKAYAEGLAADGAKVVIAEINAKAGEMVAKGIKAKGQEAIFIATDVTKYDTVQRMVETTIKTYGRIDALVNNAAIYYGIKVGPFTEISEEEWDREFAVNVKGTWNCCRAVVPQLFKQKEGKIINVSSSLAFEGGSSFMHYAASKGAIVSMTRAMANEISKIAGEAAITVNTLAPGAVFDEASQQIAETLSPGHADVVKKMILDHQTVKRNANVDDLVGALFFLVSDASNFMNSTVLCIDGGAARY